MTTSRSALIIASDAYTDPGLRRLRAPVQDASALSQVLEDPEIGNFDVSTMLNEPAHEVALAVEGFFADRHPDDLLLMHFSCHGVKDESGELFFATGNTQLRRLGATAIAADFVNRCMGRSRSRRVVLLLDCCYAGAFERGMTARAGTGMAIEEQLGGRGRAVITASSAMEYAFEGDDLTDAQELAPSVFTSALVEGLRTGEADRDQDGVVALDELYDYVYDKVRSATPNQTPGKWVYGVHGELVIARRAQPVTSPAPLPAELTDAINSPFASVRTAVIAELGRLATGRHAGLALAAEQSLQQLTNDDSRMVSSAAAEALNSLAHRSDPQPDTDTTEDVAPPTDSEASTPVDVQEPLEALPPAMEVDTASPTPLPSTVDVGPFAPQEEGGLENSAHSAGAQAQPIDSIAGDAPHAVATSKRDTDPRLVWAGVLALAAAGLAFAGLFANYFNYADSPGIALKDSANDLGYLTVLITLMLVAAVCLLIPRTSALIGPGLIIGPAALTVSAPIYSLQVWQFYSSDRGATIGAGFVYLYAANLLVLASAALSIVAVTSSGVGVLRPARPQGVARWTALVIGVTVGASLVIVVLASGSSPGAEFREFSASTDLLGLLIDGTMVAVAAAMAAVARPRIWAVAILASWIASTAGAFGFWTNLDTIWLVLVAAALYALLAAFWFYADDSAVKTRP